ncbi:amino acid permease-domain-containing protein [Halteromyces radiatus]|uniref:amino acid permease-domain-containing protein n=1 Tax=Halteromyces radiatus TaxID=101107 RepID=UPI002220BDDA|nr:amino acid permease-domain-containing protein [Halteromyces radiatus]KAI8086751.1 amino acid permease-domain-containing protein [Halteromyces radiatus]
MIGVFSRGGGIAQGSTVFGNNIVYAINAGQATNDWQARGFGGMAGRLPDRPNYQENFSFDGTLNNAGSYANAIYYVIFSYAYLAVLPLDKIRSSDLTVAANLFNTAFGGIFGSRVLPVFVGLSSFGFVGVVTYSGSRVILEFAREGHLPFDRVFSRVHPKLQTPVASLLLLYVISLIFMLAPPPGTAFQFIMAFCSYADYFFAALCAIGLLILRRREPNIKRPIRSPFPLTVFYLLVCIFTLVFVYIPPTKAPAQYPYWGKYCLINIIEKRYLFDIYI